MIKEYLFYSAKVLTTLIAMILCNPIYAQSVEMSTKEYPHRNFEWDTEKYIPLYRFGDKNEYQFKEYYYPGDSTVFRYSKYKYLKDIKDFGGYGKKHKYYFRENNIIERHEETSEGSNIYEYTNSYRAMTPEETIQFKKESKKHWDVYQKDLNIRKREIFIQTFAPLIFIIAIIIIYSLYRYITKEERHKRYKEEQIILDELEKKFDVLDKYYPMRLKRKVMFSKFQVEYFIHGSKRINELWEKYLDSKRLNEEARKKNETQVNETKKKFEENNKTRLDLVEKITSSMVDQSNNTRGIYMIFSQISKEYYIGSSYNIWNRIIQHKKMIIATNHHSYKINNLVIANGAKQFTFHLIETVDNDESLLYREQYWINKLSPKLNVNQDITQTTR